VSEARSQKGLLTFVRSQKPEGPTDVRQKQGEDKLHMGSVLLASGFWLLASGFWLLASGFWLLASGFWLLSVMHP
jgi:hypothetical protein